MGGRALQAEDSLSKAVEVGEVGRLTAVQAGGRRPGTVGFEPMVVGSHGRCLSSTRSATLRRPCWPHTMGVNGRSPGERQSEGPGVTAKSLEDGSPQQRKTRSAEAAGGGSTGRVPWDGITVPVLGSRAGQRPLWEEGGPRDPGSAPVPTPLPFAPPAPRPRNSPLGQQGQCQPALRVCHAPIWLPSPSVLPRPVLIFPFRLHGDSPPRLACIPASARDSEPGGVPPPRSPGSRSPVSAPGVSPEAALSFPTVTVTSIFQPCRVGSSGEDHPPQPPPATARPALPGEKPPSRPPRASRPPLSAPRPSPAASLPCRGPPCLSFPFVTGLANRQVFGPEMGEVGGAGKGPPGGGGWVCGGGGGANGTQDEERSLDSLLNNVLGVPPTIFSPRRENVASWAIAATVGKWQGLRGRGPGRSAEACGGGVPSWLCQAVREGWGSVGTAGRLVPAQSWNLPRVGAICPPRRPPPSPSGPTAWPV